MTRRLTRVDRSLVNRLTAIFGIVLTGVLVLSACDSGATIPDIVPDSAVSTGSPEPSASSIPTLDDAASRDDAVDALWAEIVARYPNAVRPATGTVQFVRYTTSQEDWAQQTVACLLELGNDAFVVGDDGVSVESDGLLYEVDREGHDLDMFVCRVQYPASF